MNQIIQNIRVTNPCKSEGMGTETTVIQPVKDYDRQREIAEMGQFNLEEACQNVFAMMGTECQNTLDDLKEMNANFDQVISGNQVPRGQNVQ